MNEHSKKSRGVLKIEGWAARYGLTIGPIGRGVHYWQVSVPATQSACHMPNLFGVRKFLQEERERLRRRK